MDPERWLINLISLAVTAAWLVALGASIITSEYTPLEVTTPVMLILAGYAFGIKITKNGSSR